MNEPGRDIEPRRKNNPARISKAERQRRLQEATKIEQTTTPDTDPQVAFDRIKAMNEFRIVDPMVKLANDTILQSAGLNPQEWEQYYGARQPKNIDEGFTQEDMKNLSSRYPSGLEFFVSQGEPFKSTPPLASNESEYGSRQDSWITFVRVRPQHPQIEPKG